MTLGVYMSDKKRIKYLSKTVAFQGKQISLFSIDGVTWSTRKQELLEIKERQERDKVSFAAIKEEDGETRVIAKPNKSEEDELYDENESQELDSSPEDELVEAKDDADIDSSKKTTNSKRPVKLHAVGKKTASKTVVTKVPSDKLNKSKAKARPISGKKQTVPKVSPKSRASSKPVTKVQSKHKARRKAA
jgi:hypothetical protein